jgi:D-alanyl-D-alanine carboxypeptidase
VNRGAPRALLALAAGVVVIAAWLGSPLLAAPVDPDVGMRASAATTGSNGAPGATTTTAASASAGSESTARPAVPASAGGSPGATPVPSAIPWGGTPTEGPHRPQIAGATPMLRALLDARLERLRLTTGIPGLSASILFADGSSWHGSSGLADVASKRRVTADTAFPAASISKTFTAALILGLVEDGRLRLDMPVTTYLPALAIDPTITIRQLLDHRSGLRDFYFHPRIDKALLSQPSRVWDAARSLSYMGKPYARPGTAWHYSNTNYLILGLVAEAVGGRSVAEQLHERFLEPLHLDHTYYQSVERPLGPVTHSYRFTGANLKLPAVDLSDGTKVVPFTSVVTAAGAAASIATTSADLASWARALYGGAALGETSRSEMVADALLTAPYHPTVAYGLGVQIVQIDGHLTLGHSGRFLGARAAVRWLPGEQVAIAVMTNQSRSDPNGIVADLLKLALTPQGDCVTCAVLP